MIHVQNIVIYALG